MEKQKTPAMTVGFFKKRKILFLILKIGLSNVEVDYKP